MTLDYRTLVGSKGDDGSIRQWINHAGVPAPLILHFAEQQIYQTLRIREMIQTATGTLAANADTITLPSTYRQRILFMFTGTHKSRVKPKLLDTVKNAWSYDADGNRSTGKPQIYATDASNIQFEVKALEAYTYDFTYYGDLSSLAEGNETNVLTDRYPKLLVSACMMSAYEWTKNMQEKSYWAKMLADQIVLANREADQELAGVEMDVIPEYGAGDVGQALV